MYRYCLTLFVLLLSFNVHSEVLRGGLVIKLSDHHGSHFEESTYSDKKLNVPHVFKTGLAVDKTMKLSPVKSREIEIQIKFELDEDESHYITKIKMYQKGKKPGVYEVTHSYRAPLGEETLVDFKDELILTIWSDYWLLRNNSIGKP